ncbi:tyrosine-type recombinase/integrase [Salmonella enterica subsp. diarizonae serovar 60:k:z]|nr:tyrosine-type recombinase/integrase [Salmonella enterica subsp. diarizonae]EHJ0298544.1 tyrosine-type recombinase/integrase [Salmonella enterica subsp. diarizonae serovar 60:k:z]
MTLAELCHIYLQYTRGYKKSSHTDSSKISNYIVPQLGNTEIEYITRLQIQSYLNGLTNLKNSTKNRHLNLVKAIFSFAVEHCYMDKSPVAGMRTYKEPASLRKTLEPEEFSSLIRILKEEIVAEPRDTLSLIMLLAFTGMRLGEARAGLIEDINFKQSTLFLRDSKSGDSRLVPLCREAKEVLRMQQNKYGTAGLIFRSISGGMVSEPRRLMAKLCEKAGIRKCLLHELRYTAGSAMLAALKIYMPSRYFWGIGISKRLSGTLHFLVVSKMKMLKRRWP